MEPQQRMTRADFFVEAGKRIEALSSELAKLHVGPPCLYGVDIATVDAWTDEKRAETLDALRSAVARAETLVKEAESARAALWQEADAEEEDRKMPNLIPLKLLREDLKAYEDVLAFVKSR